MRKKIIYIYAIIIASLNLTSCDAYLDLQPEDGTTRAEFWKTKEDVRAAVFGVYTAMLNSPKNGSPLIGNATIADQMFTHGEIRGGMVDLVFTTRDHLDMLTTNILPTNSLSRWDVFYEIINYCNEVLAFGPGVLEKDPTFTQEQLDNYTSEVLAIRSYMYFSLARIFRDVPLVLTATLSDGEDFQIPVTKQEDIFNQVVADLVKAESLAVEDYGDNASNKGRITKNTINTMLTDVYLWQEKYDEALIAADKVINSSEDYQLLDSRTLDWFNTVFARGNSVESIFELQYDTQTLSPFYEMFSNNPNFIAEASVLEDVFGLDFNDANNVDVRGPRASLVPGTNEIYKFTGITSDNLQRKASQESDTHWFIYRYADLLLMKAEALNELDRGQEAIDIIEDIRFSRQAIDLTEQVVSENDKIGIREYILAERSRELAFEGKRWFDILRNARKDNYAYKDIIIAIALKSAPANQQQIITAKLQDVNSHYMPINENELFNNKALVQNPFYK